MTSLVIYRIFIDIHKGDVLFAFAFVDERDLRVR